MTKNVSIVAHKLKKTLEFVGKLSRGSIQESIKIVSELYDGAEVTTAWINSVTVQELMKLSRNPAAATGSRNTVIETSIAPFDFAGVHWIIVADPEYADKVPADGEIFWFTAEGDGLVVKFVHPWCPAPLQEFLRYFEYKLLPEKVQEIVKPFSDLAWQIAERNPHQAQTLHALQRLLESRDAAVRASSR